MLLETGGLMKNSDLKSLDLKFEPYKIYWPYLDLYKLVVDRCFI